MKEKLERINTPVRVITDTTRRCNLACWYCHSTSGPQYKGPELSGRDVGNILRAAETSRIFDVTLTGGEPTLWPGLREAVAASKDTDFTSLQLITNATHINKNRLRTLQEGKLARICVSLDGLEGMHDRNRGKGMFDRTIKGIENLRSVVDNITVISVLDNTNYNKWPELTHKLIDMGVKQHHLAPVCFAGNAMDGYQGLNEDQFSSVRTQVHGLQSYLPENFTLRFNDILVGGPDNRTMSLQSFTEGYKGWHVVVRPDGKVNMSVQAWGRSWRENETIGNIHEEGLEKILAVTNQERQQFVTSRFSGEEEKRRKFHLGASPEGILYDRQTVQDQDAPYRGPAQAPLKQRDDPSRKLDVIFAMPPHDIQPLLNKVASEPTKFRLREEDGFGIIFDTNTFDITLLQQNEIAPFKNTINS